MSPAALPRERRIGTVSSQVADYLRDAIFTGRFPGGYRLDQQAIAAELGISIIPLRESLRQLEAEGLVENKPYRGAFVASMSLTGLRDIYVTREVLEELATRLAIDQMTAETLLTLEECMAEMETATAAMDLKALFDLNRVFHFTIYAASGNQILVQLIESLWDRSTVYRRVFTFMPERAAQALEEHRRILTACHAKDAAMAGEGIRENVAHTTRAIIARVAREESENNQSGPVATSTPTGHKGGDD